MNKYWIFLVVLFSAGSLFACSSKPNGGSGQANNHGGSGGVSGNANGGTGDFGNGGKGGTGTTIMTLPDGGTIMADPTMKKFVVDDTGMSGLDQTTIMALKMGGTGCTVPPIYPSPATVFPRGLPAPTVMWNGASDAAYVHMRYAGTDLVDYQFAVKMSDPGTLVVPQDAWNKIVARSGQTPLLTTLTVKTGATLSTCETNWTIAEGTMSGALYYNTYNAPGAMFKNQGAVMRLTLGKTMSDIYLQDPSPKNTIMGTGPCISCHSVSFDGSMLVASRHDYGGNAFNKVFKFEVSSYPVTMNLQPTAKSPIARANFGGLYPDGKRMLIMGNPQCTNGAETFPRAPNNFIMVDGPTVAKVVDTATGMDTSAKGLNKDFYMWMPQFSPDGKKVVFNHAKPGGTGTDRRELATMDYDYASNTFSNLKVIATNLGPAPTMQYAPAPTLAGTLTDTCQPALAGTDQTATLAMGTCTGPCYPGWPFFTPDGRGVVFLLTNEPDFASAFPGRTTVTQAELWYADLASGKTVRLDAANAMMTDNFYPTVMPVALGGYYWLFFTSKRTYGNKVYPDLPKSDTYALSTKFAEDDAKTKRIWVSGLRPIPADTEFPMGLKDISSPAFFLDGQSESGNVRAFTTLNPCTKKGDTCKSGLDCCSGYCNIPPATMGEFDVEPVGTCTDEPPSCSKTNERCTSDSNCCPPAPGKPKNTCIGGFCTFVVVPQ